MFDLQKPKQQEENAIIVENVSKHFRIPHEKKTRLFEHITGAIIGTSSTSEEFWAVKDVTFTVKKGETLGIIGENGSGKSTLLKIIAGVLTPDSGSVKVNGKIAPFLELGVGFNPELTAEDNVRLYGAIMGMSKKEMEDKFEEIFEFAELSRFRNMKLKNFSSGMYARLAFSTAVATDPDILLIDEVLAVGDVAFQKKCFDKFDDFKRRNKTIILISHSTGQIESLCEKAIFLNKGNMLLWGQTKEVVAEYMTKLYNKEKGNATLQIQKEEKHDRWGNREVEITEVKFFGEDGQERYVFKTGERMIVKMKFLAKRNILRPVFGMAIYKSNGIHINGTNSKLYNVILDSVEGEGEVEYIVKQLPLLDGTYFFSAVVYDYSCTFPYDHHDQRFTFKVVSDTIKDLGIIYIPAEWKIKKINNL
ncbi:MAG: ABC transporter ATP-binding protein [Candidatus Methanoperedens sp.]|nr:ABC transporter ATP-binding protein [Candidatus Methanoperedens sp.]